MTLPPMIQRRRLQAIGLETTSVLTSEAIGSAAALALYAELALAPKPGLVTLADSGSHDDMDARTFMCSIFALHSYFVRIARLGRQRAPFEALERCGIEAETHMLAATGGVNTHRGAIFMLGLLCAAAGSLAPVDAAPSAAALRDALRSGWGEALSKRTLRASMLPGGIAASRFGLRSASQEAALAFPVLFETAVPALTDGLSRGLTPQQARLDTLFRVMAALDDSNLAHRGGIEGLRFAQAAARRFIDEGGAAAASGFDTARAIGRDLVARRLSPGGAADTLAAACWVVRIGSLTRHPT